MTTSLHLGTIAPEAIVAIIIADDNGNERRIECDAPPQDAHFLQVTLGERIASERAFWSEDDALREHEALLALARRKGRLSVIAPPPG